LAWQVAGLPGKPLGSGSRFTTDETHSLLVDIHTVNLPASLCPRPGTHMIALRFMLPPSFVFKGGCWQITAQYSFDLRKRKSHSPLVCRKAAQVILKRRVFAGHNSSVLRTSFHNFPLSILSRKPGIPPCPPKSKFLLPHLRLPALCSVMGSIGGGWEGVECG